MKKEWILFLQYFCLDYLSYERFVKAVVLHCLPHYRWMEEIRVHRNSICKTPIKTEHMKFIGKSIGQ